MTSPFSGKKAATTIRHLGERGIIEFIRRTAGKGPAAHVRVGMGDDCAALVSSPDKLTLATMDCLVEGVHFTARTLSDEDLGWKALAVNLSDIAAMGGTPRAALLSLALKGDTEATFVESFMAGFEALAGQTSVALVGGDTVSSPSATMVTITVLGECSPEHLTLRSGAREGDQIWVTGPLGNAAAGLCLLLGKAPSDTPRFPSLLEAHQRPRPRLALGKALAASGLVHAMIDLSDGIAKDLDHICQESRTGARLYGPSVPLSLEMVAVAKAVGQDPLEWAVGGGEDYELLFTAPSSREGEIVTLTRAVSPAPAVRIGTIVAGRGVQLETETGAIRPLRGGYHHFAV